MCKVLRVSPSAYYDWKAGRSTKRIEREDKIKRQVKEIWENSRYTYGSPRVWEAIKAAESNPRVSRSLIARVMKKYGFKSIHAKKFKVTTDSTHNYPVSENVLDRNFSAEREAQKWVSDITYIATREGWLYLTVIIDLFDRKVIGWSFSKGMTANETVIPSWRMAIGNRPIIAPLLFHSDRGVQYACKAFRNLINNLLVTQSMSRKGNCWDNAVAESFFKTLKVERVYQTSYFSREQAKTDLFEYIEIWYNQQRIHSAIDQKSIKQFESSVKKDYFCDVA